jgi:predicted deacylase
VSVPTVAAGEKLATTLEVSGGSDCGPIHLPLLLARGPVDGPRIGILGGVHGDEYEGIASAATIWRELDPAVLRGTLVVV